MSTEEEPVDETEALRAEVAQLRDEVKRLRAWQAGHACAGPWCTCGSAAMPTACPVHTWPANVTWPFLPSQPQCTCGTTVRCPRHYPSDWQSTIWITQPNVCGGAADIPQAYTYTWRPGDPPLNIQYDTAGAAPQPVIFTFPVAG